MTTSEHYAHYSRPQTCELLAAIGLDVTYDRGDGDTLYYRNEDGDDVGVLDMLGGFGSGLLGHNNSALVACAQKVLATQRPFAAQASIRTAAGKLAARLSALVGETTGHEYVTTFANSGTEAVEAAIKHATLAKVEAAHAIIADINGTFRELRLRLRDGSLTMPPDLYREAEQRLDVASIDSLRALEHHLVQQAQEVLLGDPCYLALRGAFHGKTTGALKLTHNRDFRLPWQHVGLRTLFAPRNDQVALATIASDENRTFYQLAVTQDDVTLVSHRWSNIVACLVEPIQGEGGIHALTEPFMDVLRTTADEHQFALVIDEIQSGMGRTGRFLASEGVRGDYYTFSKSLGGSLAKIGAMLVQRDQYVKAFGYIHTSTFADDDFSCEIALAALQLLHADNRALIKRCGRIGDYLIAKLRRLQLQYPNVIRAVRGRGLMVGIELASMNHSSSSLLRIASEQNLLGFLLCGHLLHEHQIRVTPTISETRTIRIEPSAYIQETDIDRFCNAFEQSAKLLAKGDSRGFLRYLSGNKAAIERPPNVTVLNAAIDSSVTPNVPRVACIAHFINAEDIVHFDPTLGGLQSEECERLLEKTQSVLKPFIVDEQLITSSQGQQIGLTVYGIPYTGKQIENLIRTGETAAVVDAIQQAVDMAKERGCMQVGFTGYTSIVTDNCRRLLEDEIGLTSGNSLTVAAASEATRQSMTELGIAPADACLGVVGGVGNIGRALAEIESDHMGRMILFGRQGTRRLEQLADEIYARAWKQLGTGEAMTGIARSLAASGKIDEIDEPSYQGIVKALGVDAPVIVSTDLQLLRECNVIVAATNAPQPIITPEMIANHPTVICDVAVPNDVSPGLENRRPLTRVIKGGILTLPLQQSLAIRGLDLPESQAYACFSEAILLGLAGVRDHFSVGGLCPKRIQQIRELARHHGFQVVAVDRVCSAREEEEVASAPIALNT